MSEQIISQLETAAVVISGAPDVVTPQQRRSAEEIFLNFRKTKSPYLLCKQLLETSNVHYVLFEACELLKISLIREWSFLTEDEILSLRQYLMQYVFLKTHLPFFVQERLLQVIAIMVKRGSVEDHGRNLESILTEVENIIVNSEHTKKMLGCKLIVSLMQEYAITQKSTDVGLPWEVHFKVKKQFEATNLRRIFHFCIHLFSEIIKNEATFRSETVQLMEILLTICVVILSWGYISPVLRKRLACVYESVFEADQAPALRLSIGWREIIFMPHFLPLMFELYWKVRDNEVLAHLTMTCLVQLATVNGSIINTDDLKMQYFNLYLENFMNLLGMIQLNFNNKEVLGTSNIFRKLQLFFGREFYKLSKPVLESYLNNVTRITCYFAEGAQIEEAQMLEEKFYMDALNNVLEAWAGVFQEGTLSSDGEQLLLQPATRIFNSYLQSRLAPPDGCRAQTEDNVEIDDNEDNDRSVFKDQLQVIGGCGRIAISNSLPLLYRLLEDRSEKLKTHLQTMRSHTMTLNDSVVLDNIFEDIHWIVLISGHILCMDSDGETPVIPAEVMQYSIMLNRNKEADLETTLKFVASVREAEFHVSDVDKCDHVIRIFGNVLKLCTLEASAAIIKLGHFMSPELGSTLMWFLKRWCNSYLLPTEHFYQEISPTIIGTLGKDTDAAAFITNFVLEKIQTNIQHFSSEPVLLKDTSDLLINLVLLKNKALYIVKTEGLWNIVKLQLEAKPGSLPLNVRRGIFKGLILAGAALHNVHESDEYFTRVVSPLQVRFKNIILQENFRNLFQEEFIKIEIIDILECLIGLASGAQMSTTQILFQLMLPILSELPVFFNIYKSDQVVLHLVLELYGHCARYMLCYLNQSDSKQFYDSSLAAIKTYAEVNINRFTSEVNAEESSYQDLILLLECLTSILSKDCLDLNLEDNGSEASISACDVSLFALEFILPLIKLDLLMYPTLCAQYYKLIVCINDLYADKVANLPDHMLQHLLFSLELGLVKDFGPDIIQACLDIIQGLAIHVYKNQMQDLKIYNALLPFLKLLMNLTLSHEIPSDIIPCASVCIYTLICCYGNEYQTIVNNLIQSQSDLQIAERLADAFTQLTNDVPLTCELRAKWKFRDNFDKFLANVHGFLLVK